MKKIGLFAVGALFGTALGQDRKGARAKTIEAARARFRKEIEAAASPKKMLQEKIAEYRERFANPYVAASRGGIDEVIEPPETRRYLIQSLTALRAKRETRPPKKHGNIPL